MVLLLLGVGEKEIKHVLRVVCVVVNFFFSLVVEQCHT